MALHIVIDGYNLIGASQSSGYIKNDLESVREELFRRLLAYKRLKGHKITVVLDGKYSENLSRRHENHAGIEVIFSKNGEEADLIIKEMAEKKREGLTIVTSDRDVASFALKRGSVIIPSNEFNDILEMADYAEDKGIIDDEDCRSEKKGNPKRLSKKDRQKVKRLKKL
ncbi:MAG: NYN domain-containing protein [Deltaproteobacteria bacterium]|nr:NYN domain-containing protein [Deltaproteobacteria bacterium]